MRILNCTIVLLFSLACSASTFAAQQATPQSSPPPKVTTEQMQADLQSGDPARVESAVKIIRDIILVKRSDFDLFKGADLLLKAKKYDVVDSACLASLLGRPENQYWTAKCQRARVMALLGQEKYEQALAAAKSYYNIALFADTNDAINVVSMCLIKARPDGKALAARFKRQQTAWASPKYSPPATRSAAPATQSSSDDLGEPILPTIKADPKPFADALGSIMLESYDSYMGSGDLQLMSDEPADARENFDQGLTLAQQSQGAATVQAIACAIRDESGCLGPANAYILSLRAQSQPPK